MVRRLQFWGVCETVAKTLSSENGRRAIALDDKLMQEGWACLDPDYAADLQMMARTGFGTVLLERTTST